MRPFHVPFVFVAVVLVACHAYAPAPVDLAAHARTFAARLPTPAAFDSATTAPIDLTDGLDRREGRLVAMLFHPDCRLARARAGMAAIDLDHAGSLPDPAFDADCRRILADVPHRWIVAAGLAFTLPLNGRLTLERQLAAAHADADLLAAVTAQLDVGHALDAAWVRCSAAGERTTLLRSLCERLDALRTTAQRLCEAGQLTQPAARAFALEHLQRLAELGSAEAAATTAALELKRALGLHPDAALTLLPSLTVPLDVPDADARTARLLVSPRLAVLQAQHHVAERALELEVRKQWPDFTLRTGWEEEDADPRVALGISLPLPLLTGNDPAIAHAEGARALAAEALRGGYEQLVQQHALAEARHTAAVQHHQFVREQLVPLAEQQLDDAVQLGQLGELDPLLILDAVVRAHHARAEALAAAEEEALATINLNTLFTPENDAR